MNAQKSNISLTHNRNHPWQKALDDIEEERANTQNTEGVRVNPQQEIKSGHSSVSRPQPQPQNPRIWGESVRVVDYSSPSRVKRHRRRRPRIGIVSSSANGNESNLDSLELALQDTSKTSSSATTSTETNSRSPNRSMSIASGNSVEYFEDEPPLIHEGHITDYTRSAKYLKVSTQSPGRRLPSALEPNPTNPFAPRLNSTNNSRIPTNYSERDSHPYSKQPPSSHPSYNPFGDDNDDESGQQFTQPSENPFIERSKSPDTTHVSNATTSSSNYEEDSHDRLALHRLCEEATSNEDIAWRNALYLLAMQPHLAHEVDAQGRTALHVACTGCTTGDDPPCPPPPFMVHALFIANPNAVQKTDTDCRLPIHCLASTSADPTILQLLVEANPLSIVAQDAMGWTPLHLFIQNQHVQIAVTQIQILLGMTVPVEEPHSMLDQPDIIRQRRGDHLRMNVEHLDRMRNNRRETPRWQSMAHWNISDETLKSYPEDTQQCLRQILRWQRKRQRTEEASKEAGKNDLGNTKDISFLSSASSKTHSLREQERNPSAIFAPQDRQLPLHMIILRGLTDVHLQSSRVQPPRQQQTNPKSGSSVTSQRKQKQQHTLIVIVRLLICAYPESLIARDIDGHTPLLLAMVSAADVLPSQELLELLLGKRTAGFDSLPSWAHDVPYPIQHAYTPVSRRRLAPAAERYCNPAIVSTLDTCQLPLHIAAEEWAEHSSLLIAIYESYPGAVHVQDARGRLPLHLLLQNYRRVPPHPEIIAMLLTNRVAKCHDDEGRTVFDLLVDAAPLLPRDPLPRHLSLVGDNFQDPSKAFRHFFQPSIVESSTTGESPNRSFERRRSEAAVFLWRLRALPPWLRRHACSATFVQELLVDELACPVKFAFIMMQGLVLMLLLTAFHRQATLFIETGGQSEIFALSDRSSNAVFSGNGEDLPKNVFPDPSLRYETWNSLVIYALSAVSIGFQVVFWALCGSLKEFQHLCLFNAWRWVDILSILAAIVASTMIQEGFPDDQVLIAMTTTIGLLWCSLIGFMSTWWYGVAYFTTLVAKVVHFMLWPLLVALICVVGFTEMFQTVAQIDCGGALESASFCSRTDIYHLVYFLVVGEPVVDIGGESPSTGMTVLIVLFSILLLLFFLAVIFLAISFNADGEAIATDCAVSFWESKLAFVVSSQRSRAAAARYKKGLWVPRVSLFGVFESRLEELWGFSMCLLLGIDKHIYWYATEFSTVQNLLLKLVLVALLPLWILVGLLTFGLLWPPQVRRFIFMPRQSSDRSKTKNKEYFFSQIADVKTEVMNLKNMSYEQSRDIQQEIYLLRGLFAANSLSD